VYTLEAAAHRLGRTSYPQANSIVSFFGASMIALTAMLATHSPEVVRNDMSAAHASYEAASGRGTCLLCLPLQVYLL
jgi:hypothetical protein